MIAVVVTSNLRLARAPGNVMLAARSSGLDRDSVANVSQVVTLDKADLPEPAGMVDTATLRLVEEGLALALGLRVA